MAEQGTISQKSNRPLIAILALLSCGVVVGLWFYTESPNRVRTNDAQIDGHIHPLNARVAGILTWVNPIVDDTHYVSKGTVLARLDPNDYSPAVAKLAGDKQSMEGQLKVAELNVPISQATALSRLDSARAAVADANAEIVAAQASKAAAEATAIQLEALYSRAETDRGRYEALVSSHEVSQSEYDQHLADSKTNEALLAAARANVNAAEQRIFSAIQKKVERETDLRAAETAPDVIASAKANVTKAAGDLKRSEASLLDAKLNLGYTEILAPESGIIGRKQIESGQRVSAGQLLMTLTPPKDLWVIANFKETQLKHMKLGQAAMIHVDAYDRDFSGTVESIGGATGSKYSLLPPENATGNYVKVVQRIPVRIRFQSLTQDAQSLLPGMSTEVSVDTR